MTSARLFSLLVATLSLGSAVQAGTPACAITGPGAVCPGEGGMVYSAPTGFASYGWSIAGNGSFSGSTTGVTVTVNAGSACSTPFLLSLTLPNSGGFCQKVVSVADTTPPVAVSLLPDHLVQCDGDVQPPLQPNVTDGCDANLAYSVQILTQFSSVPGNCAKTVLYRWTIRDDCGNFTRVNQRYLVRDLTAPILACPEPLILVGDANGQAVIPSMNATATDNCGANPVVIQSPAAGILVGPGMHTVTFTATDSCGNLQTCSTTVTVESPPAGIQLLKSVYLGQDGGARCPGLEKVFGPAGSPITYCFLVVNTGQANLANVEISDPSLGIPPVAVGNLPVGQSTTRFVESTLTQDLVGSAAAIARPPSGLLVISLDPAEVDLTNPVIDIQVTGRYGSNAPCPGVEEIFALNGEPVTYCFRVENTGDTPLQQVLITDDTLGILPLHFGSLQIGQAVTAKVTVVATGSLTNLAQVAAIPSMGAPITDTDTASLVGFGAYLRFNKTVYAGQDNGQGCPGVEALAISGPTPLTYCFQIKITGDSVIYDARLGDLALGISFQPFPSYVLQPGEDSILFAEAIGNSSMTNVATVYFFCPSCGPMLSIPSTAVVVAQPSGIQLNKKLFASHGNPVGCATASDTLTAPLNSPVTYCFEVVNTGDTHLDDIRLTDLNLGIDDSAMNLISGTFPLPPGQSVLFTYPALVQGALTSVATASAVAVSGESKMIEGLADPEDTDTVILQVGPALP